MRFIFSAIFALLLTAGYSQSDCLIVIPTRGTDSVVINTNQILYAVQAPSGSTANIVITDFSNVQTRITLDSLISLLPDLIKFTDSQNNYPTAINKQQITKILRSSTNKAVIFVEWNKQLRYTSTQSYSSIRSLADACNSGSVSITAAQVPFDTSGTVITYTNVQEAIEQASENIGNTDLTVTDRPRTLYSGLDSNYVQFFVPDGEGGLANIYTGKGSGGVSGYQTQFTQKNYGYNYQEVYNTGDGVRNLWGSARGTIQNPLPSLQGDAIFYNYFRAYSLTGWQRPAIMGVQVDTFSGSNPGAKWFIGIGAGQNPVSSSFWRLMVDRNGVNSYVSHRTHGISYVRDQLRLYEASNFSNNYTAIRANPSQSVNWTVTLPPNRRSKRSVIYYGRKRNTGMGATYIYRYRITRDSSYCANRVFIHSYRRRC